MAHLGNLSFGSDIDLSQLKKKIMDGNKSILDSLRMSYDDRSYREMVSRLRSSLERETFTIKVSADLGRGLNGLVGRGRGRGSFDVGGIVSSSSLSNFREIEESLRLQERYVNDLKNSVRQARLEYDRYRGRYGEDDRRSKYFDLKRELNDESSALSRLRMDYRDSRSSLGLLTKAKESASSASRDFADNSIRLNSTLAGGLHVSSRLGSALNALFAVGYVRSFLDNVIEIGGQLEKQRISLGAILGDASRANQLFEQIKGLAVKSPFGVVELDQYSKQLSAYGFKGHELFDMTKRLADISAGAGTDIGRLANALGHVRSETALTGITLRQFSMNNIPMLKMLSDYYTEVEKRSVSVAEVRKRISKKEVSYDDVITQIKRLTDEGGMFYEMQEKISDSLQARKKNFKDSLDIMYGEIAESGVGDALKGFFETLTDFSRNWKTILSMLSSGAFVFGAYRLSVLALNQGLSHQAFNLGRLSLNTRKLTAEQVEHLLVSKRITSQQLLEAVAAKKLSVTQAELAAQYLNVSRYQLLAIANSGRVGQHIGQNALATSRYTRSQLESILATRNWASQTKLLGLSLSDANGKLNLLGKSLMSFRLAAIGMSGSFSKIFSALKSVALPIASFAVFEALFYMLSKYRQQSEMVKSVNDSMYESATESVRNLQSSLKDIPSFSPELDYTDLQSGIDQMLDDIRNYSVDADELLSRVFATDEHGVYVHTLEERYKSLREEMELALAVKKAFSSTSDVPGRALASTGGFLKDNMYENLRQYDDAKKSFRKAIRTLYDSNKKEVDSALSFISSQHPVYAEAIEGLSGVIEKVETLIKLRKEGSLPHSDDIFSGLYVNNFTHYGLSSRMSDVKLDMKRYAQEMKSILSSEHGYDFANLGELEVRNIRTMVNNVKEGLSEVGDETKKFFEENVLKEMGIKIRVAPDKESIKTDVREIEEHFKRQLGGKLHIKIGTTTNAFEAIDLIRKEYNRSKEELENGSGVLLKYKISVSGLDRLQKTDLLSMTKGNIFDYLRLSSLKDSSIKVKEAELLSELNNFTLSDPSKDRKSSVSKSDDKWLKSQRERLKELENFYKRYKEYSEYLSSDDAIEKAIDSDVFKGKRLPRNIDDYLQVLKDFRKEFERGMGSKASTERKGFLSDLNMKIDDKVFEEGTKKMAETFLKKLDEQLKEQGRRWNLYNKVLDATGSFDLSSQLAFGGSVSFGNVVEELRSQIEDSLKKLPTASGVSVDELLGMDDKGLHALGITEKAENGIYKMLKKLNEESIKLKETQVENWLEAYKLTHDYEIELGKIEVKYKRLIDAVEAQRTDENSEQTDKIIQGLERASAKSKSDLNWKRFKEEEEWGRVFGDLSNMSSMTLDMMLNKLHELAPSVNDSVEATKALYEAMDKINDVMIDRNPFAGLSDSLRDISKINSYKALLHKNGSLTADAELSRLLGVDIGSNVSSHRLNDALNKQSNNFIKSLKGIGSKFKSVEDALYPVIALFDTLGSTDISNFFSAGNNALNSAASTAEAFSSLRGLFGDDNPIGKALGAIGPYAAAASAAVSLISSIADMHDAALQKEIDASRQRQKEMEGLYKNLEVVLSRTLGGVYEMRTPSDFLDELKGVVYKKGFNVSEGTFGYKSPLDTRSAYEKAVSTKSYYDSSLASLYAQRDELKLQYDLERDKKKSDKDKLDDYRQGIKEVEDKLSHFAEDMAKALYDIDVKSWAKDLGDAIVNAWSRGEDAMKAWKDKAAELLGDLTKNIIVHKIIEGQLNDVLSEVVSEMNAKSGKLDEDSIVSIAKSLVDSSYSAVGNTTRLLDAMDAEFKSIFGRSLKDVVSGSGASDSGRNVIRGEFTEQETGLILSYINSIRADDAIIRSDVTSIRFLLENYFSGGNSLSSAQLEQQRQIAANTLSSADTVARIEELLLRATNVKEFGFYIH